MGFSTEEPKISHNILIEKKNLKRTRCSKYYWIFYSWWWERQNQEFVWVCSVQIPTEDLCVLFLVLEKWQQIKQSLYKVGKDVQEL